MQLDQARPDIRTHRAPHRASGSSARTDDPSAWPPRSAGSSAAISRSRSRATTAAASAPTTPAPRSSSGRPRRCATRSPHRASSASRGPTCRASSTSRATSSRRSRSAITCPTCGSGRASGSSSPRIAGVAGLRPLPPPPEEARLRGRRHSKDRDAAAIAHHYDVSNDFYRMVLGPSMTYSCGVWPSADADARDRAGDRSTSS